MADQIIDIPGLGPIAFPDTMKPDEVQAAAAKLHRQHAGTVPSEGAGGLSMAKHLAAGSGRDMPEGGPSWLSRIVHSIQNPSPGQQLGMDALPFAQGGIARLVEGGPLPERLPGAGSGLKAAARTVAEDVPIVRKYGPAVDAFKAAQQRASQPPPPRGFDRFMPNTPPTAPGMPSHWESAPLPRPSLADVDPYMPNLSAGASTTPPAPSGPEGLLPLKPSITDLIDRYMPNQGGASASKTPTSSARIPLQGSPAAPKAPGATPGAPSGAEAPRLVKVLADAVSDAGKPAPTDTSGTTPPPRTATPTGKPSVTPAEYDALQVGKQSREINPPSPKPAAKAAPAKAPASKPAASGGSASQGRPPLSGSNGKGAKIADSNSGADALDQLQQAITGTADVPTKPNGGSAGSTIDALKQRLSDMRREFGADRIAREINPNAPEPVVGSVVAKTGAPSAMPDIAQKALLDHLQNPGAIKDMGKFLRAINQLAAEHKRNSGPANSDTAREVSALLAKYGVIK